jgi:hypothetical protein
MQLTQNVRIEKAETYRNYQSLKAYQNVSIEKAEVHRNVR